MQQAIPIEQVNLVSKYNEDLVRSLIENISVPKNILIYPVSKYLQILRTVLDKLNLDIESENMMIDYFKVLMEYTISNYSDYTDTHSDKEDIVSMIVQGVDTEILNNNDFNPDIIYNILFGNDEEQDYGVLALSDLLDMLPIEILTELETLLNWGRYEMRPYKWNNMINHESLHIVVTNSDYYDEEF